MDKRQDFQRFEVVDVVVTAYRHGKRLVLVDKNGTTIAKTNPSSIGRPSKSTMQRKLWNMWAKWSLAALLRREQQRGDYAGDQWGTKADIWLASIRIRERYESRRGPRVPKRNRFFSSQKRTTWEKAFDCLSQQLSNARRCAFVSKELDAWNHWADTCGKNHRRKDLARRAHASRNISKSWTQGVDLFG